MNREEHLEWCKERALEYADNGNVETALASIASDLDKHEETKGHEAIELGMMLLLGGHLSTASKMREFIEGLS